MYINVLIASDSSISRSRSRNFETLEIEPHALFDQPQEILQECQVSCTNLKLLELCQSRMGQQQKLWPAALVDSCLSKGQAQRWSACYSSAGGACI